MILRLFMRAFALLALGGASVPVVAQEAPFPSLAKRPAENRPVSEQPAAVIEPAQAGPASAAVIADLATYESQAVAAQAEFAAHVDQTAAAADAASGITDPTSERWIAAQVELSALEQARYGAVFALASLDSLLVRSMVDGMSGVAEIAAARDRVLAIVDQQNDRIDGLKARVPQL